jgi:serine O-acetyltransferase
MRNFISDIEKYKKYSNGKSTILLMLTTQGLWALFVYRIANTIYVSKIPYILKKILLIVAIIYQKIIEITTGISIPYSANIGKRFYIAHHGHIIIHPKTVIGNNCNISQGVTIGISGRGDKRGVPIIGNNVYIAANAVVVGKITIADNSVIGANSLVISDVEKNTTVLGVPGVKVSNNNSEAYI